MADIVNIADIVLEVSEDNEIELEVNDQEELDLMVDDVVPIQAPSDYNPLYNKPSVNDEILQGNKTFEQLGLKSMTNLEIKELFDKVFKEGGN